MKNRRVPHLIALCFLAALVLGPGRACAYDAPDFDVEIFSPDGIFLPAEQQSSLLEALAAIASNFTGNARVDDDLREKALALSLRLDPMHYHSRLAHRELVKGAAPAATTYFDSLTLISETLWNLGTQLSRPPLQPDGVELAPYLMELALVTHPQPPAERLDLYASATGGKYPSWEKFTTLQPADNRSTTRTLSLRSEADALLAMQKRRKMSQPEPPPGNNSPPAPDNPERQPSGANPAVPIATSLTVLSSVVDVDGFPVTGRVSLTIRPPQNRIERDLIRTPDSSSAGSAGAFLPLITSTRDLPVEDVRLPSTFASERSWTWPVGAVGEVGFTPSGSGPSGRPSNRPNVLPQAAVLVGNLLGKSSLNEDFVLSGEMSDPASAPLLRDPLSTLKAAGRSGKKYLLMPASALETLVASLQKTGQLAPLFHTELISYASLADAIAVATSPTDPLLIEATAAFDEIEAVSSRMSFPELARNAKVQERLEGILTKYPNHLSARAMLGYGRLPVTPEMKVVEFAGQIEALVEPFVNLADESTVEGAKAKLGESELQLARLRVEASAEVRALIPPATALLAAATTYLSLPARDTPIARQRLDEIRDALVLLKSWFSALGLESNLAVPGVSDPSLIEGETLLESSVVTGGKVEVQQLGTNGSLFSGDRQLWWTGGIPGNTWTIRIDGIAPGQKTVSLFMVTARDYGIARISIGNLFKEIDFYSRNLLITDPIVFENLELESGEPLTITFDLIGANPDAVPSYFLGLDRLEVK